MLQINQCVYSRTWSTSKNKGNFHIYSMQSQISPTGRFTKESEFRPFIFWTPEYVDYELYSRKSSTLYLLQNRIDSQVINDKIVTNLSDINGISTCILWCHLSYYFSIANWMVNDSSNYNDYEAFEQAMPDFLQLHSEFHEKLVGPPKCLIRLHWLCVSMQLNSQCYSF